LAEGRIRGGIGKGGFDGGLFFRGLGFVIRWGVEQSQIHGID